MAIKLIYSRFVKNDLKEINEWYKKINKELWNNFTNEFRLKINLIKENPLSFELKYNNIRLVFLNKFPYGIHYSYDAEENIIEIYSVFHTSRDPEKWKERK
ncbi:type II toxin-antitoxin system RelE/ParE family toxin [Chryseobacterium cheonjiense]|uniref:Type II toxin-antitoxin system RelE/ParE family toxin n=1 Tax=Chryseobacterium cheonjiense TaxID=2728845 RepID=A0A7Y0A9Q6_9FLAO|nr:type II toxin-antitoxin system RelE/ParE family toxin [Chryseobacterium cheonjiense]NML59053.1 type II toxin-antitoxin system RelE/ParE family toxin [Chryseobacterium cheonjiense]